MTKKILVFIVVLGVLALPVTVWASEEIATEEMGFAALEAQNSAVEEEFSDGNSEEDPESEAASAGMTLGDEPEEEAVLVEGVNEEAETALLDATEDVETETVIEAETEIVSETSDAFTDTVNSMNIAEKKAETAAVGASSYSSDGFTYKVSGTPAEATITDYTGSSTNVVIPSYLGGYKVTAIASDVFKNSEMISLTIPETITSIGSGAFYNCEKLSSIQFNATNCEDCGYYNKTFYNAGALAASMSVNFGEGVKRIPAYLFYVYNTTEYYARVTSVKISNTVEEIGKGAFSGCVKLQDVTWGTGIESIGSGAFENCAAMTKVVIPAATKSIGGSAFYNCEKLSSIQFNATNCEDCEYYDKTFYNAGALASSMSVNFGEGVKRIPAYLFYVYNTTEYYARVTSAKISNTVEEIGKGAFSGCVKLQDVTWGTGIESIGSCAFENCAAMTEVVIPAATKSIGGSAFYNCEKLSSLQFNATNCEDCEYYDKTFYNAGASASSLSVTFGSNVKRIPAYMFYVYGVNYNYGDNKCAHITSVTLTDSIQEIGKSAFERCYFLSSIVWGKGIKKIGDDAFNRCIAITSVEIPTSVTEIGSGAFYYCWNLKTIIYDAKSCADCSCYSNVFWNAGAKSSNLTVTVGSNAKKIPAYLFYNNEAYNYGDGYYAHITSVTLSSGLEKIGYGSFANCYDLKTVTVNGKNTPFGDDAFKNCSSNLIFKCFSGSTAASYASKNGFKYSYMDNTSTVKVKVSATKLTSLKNRKGKKVTVKWKKVSKASGYQVQYSKNKKFSSGVKTKTIKKGSTTSVTLSKLTKKKKYYVRVRAYIKSGGKTYYSSWSNVKSVQIKK